MGNDESALNAISSIPVVGYTVSAGYGIAGDSDRAKRAAAKCTGSSLSLGGAVLGDFVAGPVGGMVGGALGGAAGAAAEAGIGTSINDKDVSDGVAKFDATSFIVASAFGAVGGATGGAGEMAAEEAGATTAAQFVYGLGTSAAFETIPHMLVDEPLLSDHDDGKKQKVTNSVSGKTFYVDKSASDEEWNKNTAHFVPELPVNFVGLKGTGGFTGRASSVELVNGYVLRAVIDGQTKEISLDSCLGNDNGQFEVGGLYFDQSCKDSAIGKLQKDEIGISYLSTWLKDRNGNYGLSMIVLDNFIKYENDESHQNNI